jgi:hypothetical protein
MHPLTLNDIVAAVCFGCFIGFGTFVINVIVFWEPRRR